MKARIYKNPGRSKETIETDLPERLFRQYVPESAGSFVSYVDVFPGSDGVIFHAHTIIGSTRYIHVKRAALEPFLHHGVTAGSRPADDILREIATVVRGAAAGGVEEQAARMQGAVFAPPKNKDSN